MSDNTNLFKIDPNNAWGLNIVNSQYAKEAGKINLSLEKLMAQFSNSVSWGAKSLYSVGAAVFLSSVCDAAMDLGGAGSALYAGRVPGAIEKESAPKIENLQNEIDDFDKKIEEETKPEHKSRLQRDQNEKKRLIDDLRSKIQNAHTTANMKMTALQTMARGVGDIPKGTQEALQHKGNANKSAYEAVQQQTGQAYDNSKATLRPFLEIDYLSGLITLANIQLK